MPAVSTEGLILKRKDFGEADRVLTVLTDRYGKISVIARGVRKINSRRAGNIEVLNRVKLHLFKAKSYSLSEAESIETFTKLKENLTLSTTAFHIIELVDRLTPEEQKNPRLYELVVKTLQILQENPRQIYVRAFEVKLLSLLGFVTFQTNTFQVSNAFHLEGVNMVVMEMLRKLEVESWEKIGKLKIEGPQALALERILRYYLEKILESGLRSAKVMDKLK